MTAELRVFGGAVGGDGGVVAVCGEGDEEGGVHDGTLL